MKHFLKKLIWNKTIKGLNFNSQSFLWGVKCDGKWVGGGGGGGKISQILCTQTYKMTKQNEKVLTVSCAE